MSTFCESEVLARRVDYLLLLPHVARTVRYGLSVRLQHHRALEVGVQVGDGGRNEGSVHGAHQSGGGVLKAALNGVRTHGLSWFDAHLWTHAEQNGIRELISEDFEHGRYYGSVRVRNPFLSGVQDLPQMYAT